MFQMLNFEEARQIIDDFIEDNKEELTKEVIEMGVRGIKANFAINGLSNKDLQLKSLIMGTIAAYSYIEELSYNGEDLEEA